MSHFELIREWAHARNIIEGATPHTQMVKLMEEIGELAHGIAKNRVQEVADGIGDAVVVLTILAAQHGLRIEDCIALAYNEIKGRKGRMINGTFVKEADLAQPNAEQMARIKAFASCAGVMWKEVLSSAWSNGTDTNYRDGHLLRQVRNEFGPEWLAQQPERYE